MRASDYRSEKAEHLRMKLKRVEYSAIRDLQAGNNVEFDCPICKVRHKHSIPSINLAAAITRITIDKNESRMGDYLYNPSFYWDEEQDLTRKRDKLLKQLCEMGMSNGLPN